MLVLTRKLKQWTDIYIDKSKLQEMLDKNDDDEVRISFKVYDLKNDDGEVKFKVAFKDDKRNYIVQRPERKKITT